MSDSEILTLLKANLSLTSDVRDEYLMQIIKSTRGELKHAGIDPDGQDSAYQLSYDMYLIDYCAWLYRTRGGDMAFPRHLHFRRNNLIIGHKSDE